MISSRRSMLRLWCSLASFVLMTCWILPHGSLVAADRKSKSKPRFSRKINEKQDKGENKRSAKKGRAKTKTGKSVVKKGKTEAKSKANSPEAALAESRKSGRPILAMAGRTECGQCRALEKRLNTDRSLKPLLKNFVPLKMDVGNREVFKSWTDKFPIETSNGSFGIPVVFIIRADGEPIYVRSGNPAGKLLPKLLRDGIKQSGTILTSTKLEKLESTVAEAKVVSKEGDMDKVVAILASAEGRDGFSEAALEAKKLLKSMSERAEKRLKIAEEGLEDDGFLALGALALIEVEKDHAKLPEVKKRVAKLIKAYEKTAAGKAALAKAKTW